MDKNNRFRDRMGVGLPDDKKETSAKKSLFSAGITNPTTGLKSSTTYTKNQAKHQADTIKKTALNDKKEQEKQGPALNTGLMFNQPKVTTRESLKESSMAQKEHNIVLFSSQLNSKIDHLIQEATAGSAPKPQRNINIEKIGHNVQEKRMIDDMSKIIEMKQQRQIKRNTNKQEDFTFLFFSRIT